MDSAGRPHDPATGRFLPSGEQDPNEPAAAQAAPVDAGAATVPPGMVRIEVPEGHPLRDQGVDHIHALESEERSHRAALNAAARRSEVEQYRQEIARLQDERIRLQAQVEARQKSGDPMADPAAMEIYQALLEVDPAQAERYKRGLEWEAQQAAEARYGELSAERQQAETQQAIQQFVAGAEQAVVEYLPPDLRGLPQMRQHFENAVALYDRHLELEFSRGRTTPPSHDEFVDVFFKREILTDPTVRQWAERHTEAQKQAEAQRIKADAEAKALADAKAAEEARLRDAAQRHGTRNPLGNISGAVRTDRASTDTQPQDPTAGLTGRNLRNAVRQSVIERARTIR